MSDRVKFAADHGIGAPDAGWPEMGPMGEALCHAVLSHDEVPPYGCCRADHHDGDHAAYGVVSGLLAVWSSDPTNGSTLNLSDCTTRRADELHATMWVGLSTNLSLTGDPERVHCWAQVLEMRPVSEAVCRVSVVLTDGCTRDRYVDLDHQVVTRDGGQ